jgi:hypothetical protein
MMFTCRASGIQPIWCIRKLMKQKWYYATRKENAVITFGKLQGTCSRNCLLATGYLLFVRIFAKRGKMQSKLRPPLSCVVACMSFYFLPSPLHSVAYWCLLACLYIFHYVFVILPFLTEVRKLNYTLCRLATFPLASGECRITGVAVLC